jgi:hypothetical protein
LIHGTNYAPTLSIPDNVDHIDLSSVEDRKKLVVDLCSAKYWGECDQQREFFDAYVGDGVYQALFEECCKIYERVLKENPEWSKK